MNNLVVFEGKNVNMIVGESGEPLFELYSVGQALGYERSNGKSIGEQGVHKLYPYKSRIDKVVNNAEIEPYVHAGHPYLTEEMIYDFMFEARTDKCKSFRKWLSNEVLPSIRQNGAYVTENITDKQQELLVKYGMPRFRKNTFLTTPVEQLETAYKECMDYHKRKSAKEKIKIEKEIISTLEERAEAAVINGSAALGLMVKTEIAKIQKKLTSRSNRSYGIKLAKANKQLDQANQHLIEYYNYINNAFPAAEEYYCLDLHGFSVNAQYVPDINEYGMVRTDYNGKPKLRRSEAYNKWLAKFQEEMGKLGEFNINFQNGIDIYLYFNHMEKFDCHNFHKSVFDALSRYFNVDDRCFHLKVCDTSEYTDNYDDGKIFFCIRERQNNE